MHVLFTRTSRNILVSVVGLGLIYYCMTNYVWDIPKNDFRPFKKGRDIAAQKQLEEDALANVQIIAYEVENKETGEKKTLPYDEYLKQTGKRKLNLTWNVGCAPTPFSTCFQVQFWPI